MTTLTISEQEQLHEALIKKRQQVENDIQRAYRVRTEIQETLRSEGSVMDLAEQSNEVDLLERARADEISLRATLAEIEHALDKFAAGTYGTCERCGEPIPFRRLQRVPEARFDTAHQAEYEQRPQEAPAEALFN